MDPKTGYCYGCARNNEEKISWKDEKMSNEWKENNIKEIMERMTDSQLKNFRESYDFKKKNGISLIKFKKNEQKQYCNYNLYYWNNYRRNFSRYMGR